MSRGMGVLRDPQPVPGEDTIIVSLDWFGVAMVAQAEADDLRAEIVRLRAVLAPFAEQVPGEFAGDSWKLWGTLTVGDVRAAAAALEAGPVD